MKVIPFVAPLTYLLFVILERVVRARRFPKVPWWGLKCVALFLLGGITTTQVPRLWAGFAASHRLLDLSGLGMVGGIVVTLVAGDLVSYWKHRLEHRWAFLWRWLHQMHHSPERLDASATFFGHPLEPVLNVAITSLVGTLVLGVQPGAAGLAGLVSLFLQVFQHANIRTPRWLGFIVHRPETHAVHHERGVHAFNYGTLVLWDMVFGTFRNPAIWQGQTGFWDGASRRMGAMLVGVDVSEPPASRAA